MDIRQQFLKELQVAFAVEDDHGDLVTVLRWPHSAHQVLSDDVLEQRSLAAAGHSQHDALHYPNLIRPQPGISMDVIPKNNPTLVPRVCGHLFVARRTHDERRMHLPLLPPGATRHVEQNRATRNCQPAEDVSRQFDRLFVAEVIDLRQQEPVAEADDAQANRDQKGRCFRKRRACWPPVTRWRVVHICCS